ncbi:transglutaminase-like domain-containing protein [Streptomyces sp. NBC_00237]|uniref:transglutaminase-like domain-containing protein n=1 Tax=Streptomyces sp. NBC_00237 TaxID=2975687 RepID=UPI002258633D|nr:transglutaminase-like domain-containing protein [Streptomyces sp. NBC_00237]MCX5204419.1 transglutaminase-like domain-containing protein [Streptomyces sp. NBC_00237]
MDEAAGRNSGGELPDWQAQFRDEVRARQPDLATLCLLIGAVGDPSLGQAGIDEAQIELDRLAGLLPFRPAGPRSWATALAELLGARCGFQGTPGDYQRLDSSLLPAVLKRRRGLPILLSVVWMEVARRAGAPVYGVALPGHFVVAFGEPGEQVLVDPFNGGRLLTGADAELLVAGATGEPLDASMLRAADPLDIVMRMLNNIRAWAAARPERSDVQLWAVELALLLPAHPARLRYEKAQLRVQRGDFLGGAAELEEYADVVEAVEPMSAEAIRGRARAARARLN